MINILPLNLFFYIVFTIIGIWLLTIPAKNNPSGMIAKVISIFLFSFMAIWISDNVLLDTCVWYVNNYDSATGNYTLTFTVQQIDTPNNNIIIILNVVLAVIGVILLWVNRGTEE